MSDLLPGVDFPGALLYALALCGTGGPGLVLFLFILFVALVREVHIGDARNKAHVDIAVEGPGRNLSIKFHALNLDLPEGGLRGAIAVLEDFAEVVCQFVVLPDLEVRALAGERGLVFVPGDLGYILLPN